MDRRDRAAPPRFAVWLAGLGLPASERETILGDLEEEFGRRAERSLAAAHAWYWGQAALFGASALMGTGWEVMTMWIGFLQTTRRLARDWRFSTAMTLILGVGIGAGLVGYSVVTRVVMQPLPYEAQDELGLIRVDLGQIENHPGISMAEVVDLRSLESVFAGVESAAAEATATLSEAGEMEPVLTARVSPGLMPLLGVEPALGRGFEDGDALPRTRAGGVILSHAFWQTRLGGDPDVLDRTLDINGDAYPVLGVMPERFALHLGKGANVSAGVEIWMPMWINPDFRNFWGYRTVVRLAEGQSFAQATAQLEALAGRLLEEHPDAYGDSRLRFLAHELHTDLVQDVRPAIDTALAGVLLLLLVAFANAASLMLGRQRAREADLAVRSAIGAGRGRLVATVLGEALVLALGAAVVGAALAYWGVGGLRALDPPGVPRWSDLGVDWSFFGAALVLALSGFAASGLYPAWKASSGGAWRMLRGETFHGGAAGAGLRRALAGFQISLALVLTFGGLLLGRSAARLAGVDLGFDPENVLTLAVPTDGNRFPEDTDEWAFHRALRTELEAMPGVLSAGAASHLPLAGYAPTDAFGLPAGDTLNWENQLANYFAAVPGYLETIGVELRRGRLIEDRDMEEERTVAVVDESLVDQLFPGEDGLGRVIKVGWGIPDVEIVGVIRHPRVMDARREVRPQIYVPYAIFGWGPLHYVVRTEREPLGLSEAARAAIDGLGAGRAVFKVRTLESYLHESMSSLRLTLVLIVLQAGLTAILAAFGLFSVMAYMAYQTRRSTAIRSALGATRPELLRHHLRSGGLVLLVAIPVGLAIALAGSRLLTGLLFEVPASDAVSLTAAALLAGVVGLLASYVPARTAASADPMDTLRSD